MSAAETQALATRSESEQHDLATPPADLYAGIASSAFSAEQQAILSAPITETEIAIRPDDGQLYMPQVHYRQRLHKAFGIGGWAIRSNGSPVVDRSQKTKNGEAVTTVFYMGLLYVNGRFVAEAMGKGSWVESNSKNDYGTALESAKSDALTRCCKDLGIGWQLWDRNWTENWKKENAVNFGGKWIKRSEMPPPVKNAPKVTAAGKGAWPRADIDSPVVAAAKANDETLAAMVGGPIPVEGSVRVRKGSGKHTVMDAKRYFDQAMPPGNLQKLLEDGRIEVIDDKTGVVSIEEKASNDQLAKIHIMRDELQIREEDYRATLVKHYKVDTAGLLTKEQASDVIERMEKLQRSVQFP